MKKMKIVLYVLLAFSLIAGLPTGAQASSKADQQNKVGSADVGLNQNTKPHLDKKGQQNYKNPDDYPLVGEGEYAGALKDTYGSYHYLTYLSTAEYSDTKMQLLIRHACNSSSTDPYLYAEFYTNRNGVMDYLGSAYHNIGGFTGNVNLGYTIDKSLYENDPYIYIRIGTLRSFSDQYFSGVTYFKVANPFYKGSGSNAGDTKYYELISNESTDGSVSEYTGSFRINNDAYADSKNLSPSAYRMDYVAPFDTEKNQNKALKKETKSIKKDYVKGDSKSFYVQNLETNEFSSISATLLYSGAHANVWVNNNDITEDEAALLGKEFDNKIYRSDVDNFGMPSDVDQNGKVNILCYNIQDGFSGSGGYVAGYFSPRDLYHYSYSNESEIFYIDTYPLMGMSATKDVSQAYSTLAHEFQHMINFNQKVFVQGLTDTDTWMDEGLSMAAEQIYTGAPLNDRIDYYNEDADITKGHSLLYWDYAGDTLANYSLSYLFMEYLKAQCGQGNTIYKELISDPHTDYQAVQNIIHKYIDPNLSFGQFMTDFRAALVLKEDTGLYGFKGDTAFDGLKVKTYSGSSIHIKGGGAIVKALSSKDDFQVPSDKGDDVTYTLLEKGDAGAVTSLSKPSVQTVGDNDTVVTGTADPNVTVKVAVSGKEIGSNSTDSNGSFSVSIPKQKAGTELHVHTEDSKGNQSEETVVTVQDKTAPAVPTVGEVSDTSTAVTGTTEAGAKVTVKSGSNILGTATADHTGAFKVTIAKQKAGTKLVVYAEDAAGNKSGETTVTVIDKTAPAAPKVGEVSDTSTVVTGTTEAGAKVTVKSGSNNLGTATADHTGAFKVTIAKQKAGTKLVVYAEDAAGNKSAETVVTVIDKTAPAAPKVGEVSDTSTVVTGTTEAGAKVTVKSGSNILGTATADSTGAFKVTIAKQKAGTKLVVYAEDAARNKSAETVVTVIDKTAPAAPKVKEVSDASTVVTGTTEAGAKVTVKSGSNILGTATADHTGAFKVTIAKQKAGTKLVVYAEDAARNKSVETLVTVIDKTAPAAPTVNPFGDNQLTITGKAEAGAKVTIKRGKTVLGTGTANSKGTYSVRIKSKQKAGTVLTAYATDKAGNTGAGKSFKVEDKTAPSAPSVNRFGDNQTTITGKAEAGAKVTIKRGKTVLGTGTANSKGTFSIRIKSKQKAGTTLTAYATDKSRNTSAGKSFKVVDKTAPGIPTAGKVTYKSTTVFGKAEKYATVYVYNGSHYVGKATANSKGTYSVHMKKQKRGSTLKIYAKDKAGNKSKYRYVKVK
ncbi:Ig-like domain-containing protein [Heyndrickxia coagulans]|uniref:Ig-like domain-containing protein n=2 Tax=Heyndrickxia coagulans TaxID=1398 RepID=UPI00214DCC5F|nr:Ig-like domain-containing protein [Heyndrickxia coagulans]